MPNEKNKPVLIRVTIDRELKEKIERYIPWGMQDKFLATLIKTFLKVLEENPKRDLLCAMVIANALEPETLEALLKGQPINGHDRVNPDSLPPIIPN